MYTPKRLSRKKPDRHTPVFLSGEQTPEEMLEVVKAFHFGLLDRREKIIIELERKYRAEGNPLAAWDAYVLCREWGKTIPEWVLQYLDRSAKRLMSAIPGKVSGKKPPDHVLESFGMKTRGKGNSFSRHLESIMRHVVVRMVLEKINENPKRMKAYIFSEVAEELEKKKRFMSNVTVEKWYNELKGKL